MLVAIALLGIVAGMIAAAIVYRQKVERRRRRRRHGRRHRDQLARDSRARLNAWLYEWLWARHRRKRLTYRPGPES